MLTLSNKYYYLIIILAAAIPILFKEQILWLIPVPIILYLMLTNSKRAVIIISFVAFIALNSGLGETLRLVIQLLTITALSFLFFKNYGTQFDKYPKLPSQIIFLVIFVLITMLFSLLFTKYIILGVEQVIRSIIFFIIVYLYYSLISNSTDIKYFLYALYAGAFVYFSLLLYEIVKVNFDFINLNQNIFWEEGFSFVHRNVIGSFFSICISIITAFVVVSNSTNKYRRYFFISIIFLLLGLILTNSRGAIISLTISTGYIFYLANRKALKKFVLSILILLPLLFISEISDLISIYFRLERISTGRDYILETVYNILSNNPIIGAGPAAAKFEMYNYMPYMLGTPQEFYLTKHIKQIDFGHAHNFYLFLYTDLGILGLIVSLLFPITFIMMGNKLIQEMKTHTNSYYALVLGIQAAGIAIFVRGIFEWAGIFSYGTITYDLPFWWIFLIMIFIYQKYIVEKKDLKLLSFKN